MPQCELDTLVKRPPAQDQPETAGTAGRASGLATLLLFLGGALASLLAMHGSTSMPSAIGLRVLMSIATKYSIRFVEDTIKARGWDPLGRMEALLDACRMRAQLMVSQRGQSLKTLCICMLAMLLGGCATTGAGNPADPWEGFNRGSFAFNDAVDRAVVKPATTLYVKAVPGFARTGVSNFFANLEDIGTSLNAVLQGKVRDGVSDLGRFGINTVLGIAGLWDPATPIGLPKHNEDFGQTLGWWGMPSGPYLVLPLLGPSTARDAPAKIIDPSLLYTQALGNGRVYWGYRALSVVNGRAKLFASEKVLDEAAIDRYAFIRDAWLQRRKNQVYDAMVPKRKPDE